MRKSAIYIRVSTHHQIDKDSLPLQRQDLINYSKFVLNISDYEVFEDAGVSAKNTDRPAFQNMMNKIRNKEFTHVLVWKIDRISRNLIDFCDMYNQFKKYNVNFVSKNEQFDTSCPIGEAMLRIILVFAELERKLTAERVKAVMLSRAEKGQWNGAPLPLGYVWDENKSFPVICPDEKKTVELIYNEYLIKKSTTHVRNLLNTNGIKTKKGATWSTQTISQIIRNPFFKGVYRYNYREPARGKIKDEKEWIVVENNHPALIDETLWQKCNDIMDINAQRNNASGFRSCAKTHVFASLLRCGECNGVYYAKQDQPNKDGFIPSIYVCVGRYNQLGCNQRTISCRYVGTFILKYITNILKLSRSKDFNNIGIKDFKDRLLDGLGDVNEIENIEEIYEAVLKSPKAYFSYNKNTPISNDFEIDGIKKEKTKFKRALERLENLYLFDDESMPEKDYIVKKKKLNEKIKELDTKLKDLNHDDMDLDKNILDQATIFLLYKELLKPNKLVYKELIKTFGRDVIKKFMNTILDNIVIKDRKIQKVTFKNGLTSIFIYEP